jgi:putative nucleotidyltransferase with HDIG domain
VSLPAPEPPADHDDPGPLSWLREDDTAVPVLPALAHRVIDMACDPDVHVTRLAAVVMKDQVLAARVLQMANSAFSSPLQTISTVAEAVVRLGTAAVRNVVVTVCLASRMHDPEVYGARGSGLVDHALGTAYLARFLAERARVSLDEAFLCGLLHDIGKLVILKQAHRHRRQTGQAVPEAFLDLALLEHHAAMGSVALRKWRLPDTLDEPVLYHHDYLAAPTMRREAAVIYAANLLAHRYGFGCDPQPIDLLADPVSRDLRIDAEWVESLDTRAPGLVQVARQGLA